MKNFNREAIQRMFDGRKGGGGGGTNNADLAGYATQMWVNQNYVSIEFFNRLFSIHGHDPEDESTPPTDISVLPNDMDSIVDSIESMVGFWTEEYLSALGQNDDQGGGGITLNAALASINSAPLGNPTGTSTVLMFNGTTWVYATMGSTDMNTVWNALAAATNQQINISHLTTALSGYATTSQLSDYATVTDLEQLASYFNTLSGYFTNGAANEAVKLETARTIWGQSFDGTANVKGDITQATSLEFDEIGAQAGHGGYIDFHFNGASGDYTSRIIEDVSGVLKINNTIWAQLSGNVSIGTSTISQTYKLDIAGYTKTTRLYLADGVYLEYDSTNSGVHLVGAGFYSDSYVSALGVNSGGGGGSDYIPLTGSSSITGTLAPSVATADLGSSTNKWRNIYGTSLSISNTLTTYTLTVNSSATVVGSITATNGNLVASTGYVSSAGGYKVTGKDDTYVLLAGGGTKALSTFGSGVSISVNGGTPIDPVSGVISITGLASTIYVGNTPYAATTAGAVNLPEFAPSSALNDYLPLSAGESKPVTGVLFVKNIVKGWNYTNSNNAAAFVFDKNGSNATGIGSHNISDTIWFGACNSAGAWIDNYKQIWQFNGNIKVQNLTLGQDSGGEFTITTVSSDDDIKITANKLTLQGVGDSSGSGGTFLPKGAKFQNVCIECNSDGTYESGRVNEINDFGGPLYLQYNNSKDLYLCTGTNGGNVGIGQQAPTAKLHVGGNAKISNALDAYTITAGSSISSPTYTATSGGYSVTGKDNTYVLLAGGGTSLITSLISSNYVTISTEQTISALKTFTGGLMVSGRAYGGGDDEGIIIGYANNGLAGLILGGRTGRRSVFYLQNNASVSPSWTYNDGTTSYKIYHPAKNGTIAVTDDIPSVSSFVSAIVVNDDSPVGATNHVITLSNIVRTTGSTMTGCLSWQNGRGNSSGGWNNYTPSRGLEILDCTNTASTGAPSTSYYSALHIGGNYWFQLCYGRTFGKFYLRGGNNNGVQADWKTILFQEDLSSIYVEKTGDTMTGKLTVKSPIFGFNYSTTGGTNKAAFIFDKPGSKYTGIGAHSTSDTIWFGACSDTDGTWLDSYKQIWQFNGQVKAEKFVHYQGTSSQFLKADGSVDSTSYLALVNGNAQIDKSLVLGCNASGSSSFSISTSNADHDIVIQANKLTLKGLGDTSGSGGTLLPNGAKFYSICIESNSDGTPNSGRSGEINRYNGGTLHLQYDSGTGGVTMCQQGFTFTNTGSTRSITINASLQLTCGSGTPYTDKNWVYNSDMRKKDVIRLIDMDAQRIADAPIFDFTWKSDAVKELTLGSSAQYWQTVFPNAVRQTPDGYLGMDYSSIALASAVLTARKVVDHEARIRLLEVENAALRNEINQLKKVA